MARSKVDLAIAQIKDVGQVSWTLTRCLDRRVWRLYNPQTRCDVCTSPSDSREHRSRLRGAHARCRERPVEELGIGQLHAAVDLLRRLHHLPQMVVQACSEAHPVRGFAQTVEELACDGEGLRSLSAARRKDLTG